MNRLYVLFFLWSAAFCATAQTPVQVLNYHPSGNGRPVAFRVYNNKLYLNFDSVGIKDRLCAYDTVNGIKRIPLFPALLTEQWKWRGEFNGKLHVIVDGASTGSSGRRVNSFYVYDGINPVAPAPGLSLDTFSILQSVCTAGGKLYFSGTPTVAKSELFCYTGSGRATMINYAPTLAAGPRPENLTECNGKLYFAGLTSGGPYKIHVLDPATNNVSLLTSGAYPNGFQGTNMYSEGGKLFFIARTDTPGNQVFVHDGTGIRRISNFQQTDRGATIPMCLYGESLYFSGATTENKYQLYRCGTAGGPNLSLAAVIDSTVNPLIGSMVVYKNKLYFDAVKASTGREYWRYDRSGLSLVADLCPGTGNGTGTGIPFGELAVYQDRLYLRGDKCGGDGTELFRLFDPGGTGIERAGWDGSVRVYPNPVVNLATLVLDLKRTEILSAALTDIQGREVWRVAAGSFPAGRSELKIPMQELAAGVYMLRISDGAGQLQATRAVIR